MEVLRYTCQRFGEAAHPGPYTVGGATSSGAGPAYACDAHTSGERQAASMAVAVSHEEGRKGRSSVFDSAEGEDPYKVLDTEWENELVASRGTGGATLEAARDAEDEWLAMQERQLMDGDAVALHGGMHEIDEDEGFTICRLGDEALPHSCSISVSRAEGKEKDMEHQGWRKGGAKVNGHEELTESYTIREAKMLGMQAIDDSPLVQEGYVGRESNEPLLEEEIRILKGRMPRTVALFDMLNEATEKEAGKMLGEWKARKELLGNSWGGGRRLRGSVRKGPVERVGCGSVGRKVFQGTLSTPPAIEEDEGGGGSGGAQHTEVQAYRAKDDTRQGDRPSRGRGRRQRGEATCEVIMINSSGLPQLLDTVDVAARRGGKVAAILNQEHHKSDQQVADMQSKLRSMHWRAAIAPATVGEGGGNSAGVAILAPLHVGCGRIKEKEDISPSGAEGRVAMAWVQKIVPCGVVAITAYLYTCEGPSPRNIQIIARALQAAKECGSPWMLGADFQDGPEALKKWAGKMVEHAGGRWVYTDEPTVYPSTGCPRTIDYFIVSDKLAPFLKSVRVFDEVSTSPHRALLATFRSRSSPIVQLTLRTPKRFPRVKPKGCARHPVAPHDGFMEGVRGAATQEEVKGELGGGVERCGSGGRGRTVWSHGQVYAGGTRPQMVW